MTISFIVFLLFLAFVIAVMISALRVSAQRQREQTAWLDKLEQDITKPTTKEERTGVMIRRGPHAR